jgi:signal transduction histidine kinase
MKRNPGSGRALRSSTIALLTLAAVLASALAWEAVDASRSHEAVARASIREQATFAATNFAREARDEVLFDLLDEGVEVVEATLGWNGYRSGDRERFERMAREERWPFTDRTVFFFRRDLPGRGLTRDGLLVSGTAPAALLRWAEDEIDAFVARGSGERRIQVAFAPAGDEVLAWDVSSARGRDAIHGLVLTGDALQAAFEEAFREERLLPEALTSGLDNHEIFLARVLGPDDRVLYASSDAAASEIAVEHPLDPEFGGMRLELLVLDDALDVLVAGGVPESRLPFVLALLGLTGLLLGTAVWQLRREAELARLRADFVSGVSHQLLTPLTQIRMFGETLLLGRVRSDEERARAAEIIVDEATRLSHQVENVLTFSRGEADAVRVSPVETDISGLLEELIEGYEPLAGAEGVSIRTAIDADLRGSVDPDALRQALLNLLDNAVKYGRPGQTLEVGATRDGDALRTTIWVEDEGPGIPKKDRGRIWDAYVRLDEHREGASGGSGIGLAVVRRDIEALGGSVRVEDSRRPGMTGARFLIELPRISRSA